MRVKAKEGVFFECPGCRGRAIGLAVVRRVVEPAVTRNLWQRVTGGASREGAECPACRRAMAEDALPFDARRALHLDVCVRCQVLWFDPHEFEQLPAKPLTPEPIRELPAEAREVEAIAKVQKLARQAERADFGRGEPDEAWKWIPAMFGLPVEHEIDPLEGRPWYTWLFVAALLTVAAISYNSGDAMAQEYGLIPAQAWRYGGLTFVTSFFLHAGLLHVLGNAYFLLVFGDNVEDYVGSYKFLLLLVLATLAGDFVHILGDPRSEVPCVGASGGISGVIVFYALIFPRARLGILLQAWFAYSWLNFPAYFGLICWLVFQSAVAYMQVNGLGNISGLAHLGGAGVGLCAWLLWRNK